MTMTRAPLPFSASSVGFAARMRVPSAILPSSIGTLRSSRTSTRLPRRPRRSNDAFNGASEAGGHEGDQVDHPAAEPPLVVVPGDDLRPVIPLHEGQRRVDDGRVRVVLEVGGDELLAADGEDPAQRPAGRLVEGGVDLLNGRLALQLHGQVDDRDVQQRHPEGHALEAALELRQHLRDGAVGAGRGRDDVVGGGSRTAEVLVGQVLQLLVRRVGVDGAHHSPLNAEAVVEHLDHRDQAVRRAAPVGDDVHLGGVVGVLVHAHHEGVVLVGRRRRDDHLLGAATVDVDPRLVGVGEEAGRLDHDLDAEVPPLEPGRVALAEEADGAVADAYGVAVRADGRAEGPQRRVVLQKMGEGVSVADVVDGDDLEVRVELGGRPVDVPADPAEPVDPHFDGHAVKGKRVHHWGWTARAMTCWSPSAPTTTMSAGFPSATASRLPPGSARTAVTRTAGSVATVRWARHSRTVKGSPLATATTSRLSALKARILRPLSRSRVAPSAVAETVVPSPVLTARRVPSGETTPSTGAAGMVAWCKTSCVWRLMVQVSQSVLTHVCPTVAVPWVKLQPSTETPACADCRPAWATAAGAEPGRVTKSEAGAGADGLGARLGS